ncbi:HEAT repeat domain-containing protein, partial [Massilia pseudoviolaceinigra]|uniref:HEAT repeat domain-containing protein n=1 Tax=Massilia pseudoviolaceinigra TaxID=3057165 RepID=UPI00279696D5
LAMRIASKLRRQPCPAQQGTDSAEYAPEETLALLLAGMKDAIDNVVVAAVAGFGYRPHPLALPSLLALATHTDARIRFQVGFALANYDDDASIDALVAMADDPMMTCGKGQDTRGLTAVIP